MSYQAITWVNRDKANNVAGTKLNAENMNRIEQGIKELAEHVATIDPKTGTGLTDDQLKLLTNVKDSLKTVQDGLDSLKKNFEIHVHSNEAGNTTGAVIIETSSPTTGA